MITTSVGSRQIQNGGSTPGPSLVSSLTIDVMDESVAGMYTCSGPSNFQSFQLVVNVDVVTGNFSSVYTIKYRRAIFNCSNFISI